MRHVTPYTTSPPHRRGRLGHSQPLRSWRDKFSDTPHAHHCPVPVVQTSHQPPPPAANRQPPQVTATTASAERRRLTIRGHSRGKVAGDAYSPINHQITHDALNYFIDNMDYFRIIPSFRRTFKETKPHTHRAPNNRRTNSSAHSRTHNWIC